MPWIELHHSQHYYEQAGNEPALVFVHGAFCDHRMWEPQWQYFTPKFQLLRYDLRGHGKTGESGLEQYTIDTFSSDLAYLLDELRIPSPVICGQSFGGIVAQSFAVRYPNRLRGLILSGTMVAIDLTFMDKLLSKVLFPKWAMMTAIRLLKVSTFTHFSLYLGRLTKGKQILSQESSVNEYLEKCMLQITTKEYLKIWDAMYGFKQLPLHKITCPMLVLNGEYEPKGILRHTEEILRNVPHAQAKVIPASQHASNLENPQVFNQIVEEFLTHAVGSIGFDTEGL